MAEDRLITVPEDDWQAELDALRNRRKFRATAASLTDEQRQQLLAARSGPAAVPWRALAEWWQARYGWGSRDGLKALYDELVSETSP
jgi:hypothetical protein